MNTTGAGLPANATQPASAAQPAGASSVPPALVTSSSTPMSAPASTPNAAPATQVTMAAPTNLNVSTTIVPNPNRFNRSFYSLSQCAFWDLVYMVLAITSGISGASYMRVIGWDATMQAFRDALVNREVRFAGPSTSAQSRQTQQSSNPTPPSHTVPFRQQTPRVLFPPRTPLPISPTPCVVPETPLPTPGQQGNPITINDTPFPQTSAAERPDFFHHVARPGFVPSRGFAPPGVSLFQPAPHPPVANADTDAQILEPAPEPHAYASTGVQTQPVFLLSALSSLAQATVTADKEPSDPDSDGYEMARDSTPSPDSNPCKCKSPDVEDNKGLQKTPPSRCRHVVQVYDSPEEGPSHLPSYPRIDPPGYFSLALLNLQCPPSPRSSGSTRAVYATSSPAHQDTSKDEYDCLTNLGDPELFDEVCKSCDEAQEIFAKHAKCSG
ncbi:hypothetical protein CPB84DRAFT_1851980 [Gymnopilus junonius]|uniref:Uncharacterized protein n=1 Tax=Gymnopilus junonius TaxID=109634 RepID=A0A9P5NC48_GYMJU|nr:hypothetical protein CPB84DRAFT_1851980 [Gymnopilus junonius]